MDQYTITRTTNTDPSEYGHPLLGTHVIFRLAQRGQPIVGYTPPPWISRDDDSIRYLLKISMNVDVKYAIEQSVASVCVRNQSE